MIRELPRGPFDSYLRAHYFNDKPSILPRFSMGCGAIFMIQRVKAVETSLSADEVVIETDPQLLEEMVALVIAQGLEVVSLAEMRRRLAERNLDRRFVCFTFDGAYRSILDRVAPLFEARAIPFAVYAATDYLSPGAVPWWLALEALVSGCDRVAITLDGIVTEMRCRSQAEKQHAYAGLSARLKALAPEARRDSLDAALTTHGIDREALALREMLSAGELKALADGERVTVGTLGGGQQALASLGFDDARQKLEQSLATLEAAIGQRPAHLAFPASRRKTPPRRDVEIAAGLGLETAVTGIEGALWPEHARELLALPRIALDNDPATLVRALMLSGSDQRHAGSPEPAATRRAAG